MFVYSIFNSHSFSSSLYVSVFQFVLSFLSLFIYFPLSMYLLNLFHVYIATFHISTSPCISLFRYIYVSISPFYLLISSSYSSVPIFNIILTFSFFLCLCFFIFPTVIKHLDCSVTAHCFFYLSQSSVTLLLAFYLHALSILIYLCLFTYIPNLIFFRSYSSLTISVFVFLYFHLYLFGFIYIYSTYIYLIIYLYS